MLSDNEHEWTAITTASWRNTEYVTWNETNKPTYIVKGKYSSISTA
jgi:hypothetical protein